MKIIGFLFLLFILGISCFSQEEHLSTAEINLLLRKIDTLSAERNYHVWLHPSEGESVLVSVWINNRLGGTMFQSVGLEICRFYDFNGSKVFVYEQFKDCECEVPIEYMCKSSRSSYAYLEESPFFDFDGFERILIVKRIEIGLEFKEAPPVEIDWEGHEDFWDDR